ncbi:hypothetical protein ACP70R_031147 [Stipagrostis hirtigluma subsp. patula]
MYRTPSNLERIPTPGGISQEFCLCKTICIYLGLLNTTSSRHAEPPSNHNLTSAQIDLVCRDLALVLTMGNAAATPAFAAAPSAAPTIKLLIAKEAQVVVLAEAGKDVVDFLLGLLALPVGAVVKLLGKEETALAGLASLYASVRRMDAGYMQSQETRDALLNPAPAHPALVAAAGGFPTLVQPTAPPPPPPPVPGPGKSTPLKGLALPRFNIGGGCHCASCLAAQAQGSEGFVRGLVTYTVMDDLAVAPMSNISSIALLNQLGVGDLGALEERTVKIGYQEGLEILKASLQSKTVLTDVFLNKKKRARTAADRAAAAQQQQPENRGRGDPATGNALGV